ncbi:uncharacterized protein [Argopecten irradians]|uniref:uncharacterized protein n=1 Tax=Argopecten irradians TaxID=31199 RepID=UPI003714ACE3
MSEVVQKKLLAEKDFDLAKATEIALAVEMATKKTEEMGKPVSFYPKSDGVKSEVDKLLAKHHKLLEKGLGIITEFKAEVQVKDGAQAVFCKPLHELLRQDKPWNWTSDCEKAFKACKFQLSDERVLVHHDINKALGLVCDASANRVGAVISHISETGEERPIAYASRTLSKSEKNYAKIEKEAPALVFGYDIVYRKSEDHANTDALSRLPLKSDEKSEEFDIYHFTLLDDLPITSDDIATETRRDSVLSKVLDYILRGWPNYTSDSDLQPNFRRKDELSKEIVSDNGPQFTSSEFELFLSKTGVKHTLVAPYHPASMELPNDRYRY